MTAKRPAAHVLRNEAKEARWSVACWGMDARGRSGSMDFCPKCIAAARHEPLTLELPDEWNDHTPDRGPQ